MDVCIGSQGTPLGLQNAGGEEVYNPKTGNCYHLARKKPLQPGHNDFEHGKIMDCDYFSWL